VNLSVLNLDALKVHALKARAVELDAIELHPDVLLTTRFFCQEVAVPTQLERVTRILHPGEVGRCALYPRAAIALLG
jgi:hypothetical protein